MIIRAQDVSRVAPRPDITIIRNAADCYVKIWNVPEERTSRFFYCYYNYTPDAAEIIADNVNFRFDPDDEMCREFAVLKRGLKLLKI